MTTSKIQRVAIFAVLLTGIILHTASVLAADKSMFNRKVIEIIVATKVGGGYDADGRLIAPFLQKELPLWLEQQGSSLHGAGD